MEPCLWNIVMVYSLATPSVGLWHHAIELNYHLRYKVTGHVDAGFAFRHTGQGESADLALPHNFSPPQNTGQDGASEYLAEVFVEPVSHPSD